jgi:hypothetical protein
MEAANVIENIIDNGGVSPELTSELPPLGDFLKLVEDEQEEASQDISGYSVYHKYYKSC